MIRQRWKVSNRGRRGNAIIEFAVASALLFPVLIGSFQFGYAFYVYNQMQTASRAGARYASIRSYDSSISTPSEAFTNSVRNVVVYGDPAGGETPVVNGLAPENVTVEMEFVDGAPRNVTIGIVDYQTDAVFKLLEFTTKPRTTYRYTGRWSE